MKGMKYESPVSGTVTRVLFVWVCQIRNNAVIRGANSKIIDDYDDIPEELDIWEYNLPFLP